MANSNVLSYPSVFRPTHEPDQKANPDPNPIKKGCTDDNNVDPVPVIDLECLDENNLDRVCREWGVFRLVNHGVPIDLLRKIKEHVKTIFDLPFESKQTLENNANYSPAIKYFWGSPALTARANADQNMDWVEGLNVPLDQLIISSSHHDHDNRVVDDSLIKEFRNLVEEYKGHVRRVTSTIFEAMVRILKLEVEEPGLYFDESTDLFRAYRYPPVSVDDEHANGMHVHTDNTILAILNENEVGGLQFIKDDRCFDVKPIPSSLIVQLGDMTQALSNDAYKSVKHKVKANKEKERVSICYFQHPKDNTLIQSSKYKPFTYSEFRAQVHHELKTCGRKIGLPNFKLP